MGINLLVSSTSNTGPTEGAIFIDITGTPTVTGTLIPYTANDKAATLPNGTLACLVGGSDTIKIFTFTAPSTFTEVAEFDGGTIITPSYWLNINEGTFWGLINIAGIDASFYKFGADGIVLNAVGEVTGTGNGRPFCVSIDETIGYWYDFTTSIKRWDLVNNIALTDLTSSIDPDWFIDGMYNVQGSTDIVVGVALVTGAGNNKRIIARYTAAGATVYSIEFYSIPSPSTDSFEEFCLANTLDSFWNRSAGPPSYDLLIDQRFMRVLFSDGSIADTVDVAVLTGPIPGNTCFLADLTTASAANYGGIYKVVPDKTFDELFYDTSGDTSTPGTPTTPASTTGITSQTTIDVKIPNPTARIFPLGE